MKKQTQELRGKMAEERQVWEDKYKTDTKERSQDITELKIKLRAEKIGRAELQAENQSIWNALHAMEQSLVEHKNYIVDAPFCPGYCVHFRVWVSNLVHYVVYLFLSSL